MGHPVIVCAVYIHPAAPKTRVEEFLNSIPGVNYQAMIRSGLITRGDPLIITGDFNSNIQDDRWLIEFIRNEFMLTFVQNDKPTTIGNTIIDLTFVRGLEASSIPFISYFSYHRPLFNKVLLNYIMICCALLT
jgi:hypothetical protein